MGVQVHTVKMVVISLVKCKVYKSWVGKSYDLISVDKKTQKGQQMYFMAVKKSRKRSRFVI